MNRVIAKLSSWHRLYHELQDARLRLKRARAETDSGFEQTQLEAEVSRLQQESESMLEELKGLSIARGAPPATHLPGARH
jgi:hypothetical protein